MKVLFLGSVIKTEDCTKYRGPSVAGNKMQLGLIKGLYKIFKNDLSILTEPPIASFPKEKRIYIGKGKIQLQKNIVANRVPFINIFIVKQIILIVNAFFMIYSWVRQNKNEKKVIICFNSFPYISLPAILAKKLFNVKIVCILADPPIDVINRGFIGKIAKKLEDSTTEKNIKEFDGLIVLNEKVIEKYAPKSKFILVDGGFDLDDAPKSPPGGQWTNIHEDDVIRLVFSGALLEYNGIKNLVEASKLVKSNKFVIEIYGSGPLEQYVKEVAQDNSRIKFMGNVPNSQMIRIQQEAGILLNPRPANDPISLYTFPSKMIEYLISGTPVATTKLNGLTDDYLQYVFIFDNEGPEEIAKTIDNLLIQDVDYLIAKAKEARNFIINNKNWDIHSKKIKEFIDLLY
ncbi:glycosyltransferase [Sporosarcina sp. HYO08]|uniref:glycosyltransferase n=1 Tax=Sporosarcina sp. HYO08 TaxID=1759557 RepID=UPI0007931456|nr:glycosyltransferase [Sporosarcina sp. HYO08]KXH86865.1 hypothetical protein AU377_13595 [Sporosarcina sp. HYO08]